jgi:hypothetical protein
VKRKPKPFVLTSLTKGGMGSLIDFYTKKMGCSVIEAPHEMKDRTGRWTTTITHPFPEDA